MHYCKVCFLTSLAVYYAIGFFLAWPYEVTIPHLCEVLWRSGDWDFGVPCLTLCGVQTLWYEVNVWGERV